MSNFLKLSTHGGRVRVGALTRSFSLCEVLGVLVWVEFVVVFFPVGLACEVAVHGF